MEKRMHVGPPESGSDREAEFESGLKYMRDAVLRVINERKEGAESEDIPLIDALLQTQVPDEQVGLQ